MIDEVKHSGCYYCGRTDQQTLKSVVKETIDPKGRKTSHVAGQALCDTCLKLPILDLRVPMAERLAA